MKSTSGLAPRKLHHTTTTTTQLTGGRGYRSLKLDVPICRDGPTLATRTLIRNTALTLRRSGHFGSRSGSGNGAILRSVALLSLTKRRTDLTATRTIYRKIVLTHRLASTPTGIIAPRILTRATLSLTATCNVSYRVLRQRRYRTLNVKTCLKITLTSSLPPGFVRLVCQPADAPGHGITVINGKLAFSSNKLGVGNPNDNVRVVGVSVNKTTTILKTTGTVNRLGPGIRIRFVDTTMRGVVDNGTVHPNSVLATSGNGAVRIGGASTRNHLALTSTLIFTRGLKMSTVISLTALAKTYVITLNSSVTKLFARGSSLTTTLTATTRTTKRGF